MMMKHAPITTLLRTGLGAALLALIPSCSGDVGAGTDAFAGWLGDRGSDIVDAFDDPTPPQRRDSIEKATFDDSRTFEGFNVACSEAQKLLIRAADARARQILDVTLPATGEVRVNPGSELGKRFVRQFFTSAPSQQDLDFAVFHLVQKLLHVYDVLPSAVHTCHGPDELVGFFDDAFRTCDEMVGLAAATSFAGGAENAVRWCDYGLEQNLDEIAITLVHELSHQDRTADATGTQVIDKNDNGLLYNAHNISGWLRSNL